MRRTVSLLAAAALVPVLAGCVETETKAEAGKSATSTTASGGEPRKNAEKPEKETAAAEKKDGGLMKEVFSPPAPSTPADDPRVIQGKTASKVIEAALDKVRQRVTAIRSKLEVKASPNDMGAVVAELLEMTDAGRADCDAVQRAAEDVRTELWHAQEGYEAAASAYRARARGYREPFYRSSAEQMAEQLDQLAADTPRRIQVTERFIAEVTKAKRFLAETSQFLRLTESAVAILSVAPEAPRPSPKAEFIRSYLGQFLDAIERFQGDLLKAPWAAVKEEPSALPLPAKPDSRESDQPAKPRPTDKDVPVRPEPTDAKRLGPAPERAPKMTPREPAEKRSAEAAETQEPAGKVRTVPPPTAPVAVGPRYVPTPAAQGLAAQSVPGVSWYARNGLTGEPLVYCGRCRAYHPVNPAPTFAYRPVTALR